MKKLTAALLALIMALTLCTAAWADTPTAPSYAWFDGQTGTYTISNDADLIGFANIVNGTRGDGSTPYNFKGATVKLANDIDLGGMTWTPLAAFGGTFDGQGNTIKNFELGSRAISSTAIAYGFFADVLCEAGNEFNGGIKNLILSDVTTNIDATTSEVYYGTLARQSCVVAISNVTVQRVNVTSTGSKAVTLGGMFGFCGWTKVDDCKVADFTFNGSAGQYSVGGFAGQETSNGAVYDTNKITNCDVSGVKITLTGNTQSYVGGFVGYSTHRWNHPWFSNCDVTGIDFTVSGKVKAGGFTACPKSPAKVTNCTAQGKINAIGVTDAAMSVGGFYAMGTVEWAENTSDWHRLENCTADVDIVSGGATAGGFFGTMGESGKQQPVQLTNCTAKGDVSNETGIVGGFIGTTVGNNKTAANSAGELPSEATSLTGCVSTGKVEGKVAGGFAGEVNMPDGITNNDTEINLTNCEVKGTVVGSEAAGGFVGQVKDTTNSSEKKITISVDATNKADSALVVATKNDTKTSGSMNMQTPTDSNVTVAPEVKKATTVKGEGVTVDNGVVNAPNGATVTGQNGQSTQVPAGTQMDAATGNQLFTVTFVSDGVTKAEKSVASGAKVTAPTDLTKEGYHIAHWHRQGGTDTAFDFNTGITESITLVAHWEKNTYTVKFNTDGGSAVADKTVVYGDKVTKPANPTKSGYTFTHWHVAGNADDVAFDFNTPITGNIELTAHWTRNSSGRYHGSSAPTAPVQSPKTFDAGVAVYGVVALTSALGMGYIGKKKF